MNDSERDDEAGARPPAPVTVFVSDPSAEAERVAQALRAEGYVVVDVPLSMLVARVAVQRPRVILIDADTHGAVDAITRVHELDESDAIDVVLLGKTGEALGGAELAALVREASGYFERPVDVTALLKKLEEITGGSEGGAASILGAAAAVGVARASLPPPSIARRPCRRARGTRPRRGRRCRCSGSRSISRRRRIRRTASAQGAPLSSELEMLLVEAEQRIGGQMGASESMLPSPEEEIEAVLPAEVLASLDGPRRRRGRRRAGRAGAPEHDDGRRKVDDGRQHRLGAHARSAARRHGRDVADAARRVVHRAGAHARRRERGIDGREHDGRGDGGHVALPNARPEVIAPPPPSPEPRPAQTPPPMTSAERQPAPRQRAEPVEAPKLAERVVLGASDAPAIMASAVAERRTGVLAFQSRDLVRRVAFRDGDVMFAASTSEDESLLPFLAARGELPRDRVAQLAGKVPPFGRHAGAALVAHGYLRQDALWSVLRAHAEWVLARIVATTDGTAGFEDDPPARVKGEPSVFGASTGAEVIIEVVRRVIAPADALARLGGDAARVTEGANAALQRECALGDAETEWLARAHGKTVGDAITSAAQSRLRVGALRAVAARRVRGHSSSGRARAGAPARAGGARRRRHARRRRRPRPRARAPAARRGGGLLRGARRRAGRDELRGEARVPRASSRVRAVEAPHAGARRLEDDVQRIASVLDEAYEILRDGARRERYRRAIDATPR